jgi:uncharacterized protein YbjT (DUF2867 family)
VSQARLAVTGGTGFVGSTLIRLAVEQGFTVKALTRRPQPPMKGVTWIEGALDQPESLSALVTDVDAIIHIAGVINSPTHRSFFKGNVSGTRAIVAAARQAGVARFIHVSSLSAREPKLSCYGQSKSWAEKVIRTSGLNWTMVRPPAIYGPGDTDHLDLFKAARFWLMPLPPRGRLSAIEVSDLARLLLALPTAPETASEVFEVDDGREGGWTHAAYARAIGLAMGRSVIPLHVPAPIVRLGARLDRMLRGDKAKLTLDRAAYFCHPDWVIDPTKRPPPALWTPQIKTSEGLLATARTYRERGWL